MKLKQMSSCYTNCEPVVPVPPSCTCVGQPDIPVPALVVCEPATSDASLEQCPNCIVEVPPGYIPVECTSQEVQCTQISANWRCNPSCNSACELPPEQGTADRWYVYLLIVLLALTVLAFFFFTSKMVV